MQAENRLLRSVGKEATPIIVRLFTESIPKTGKNIGVLRAVFLTMRSRCTEQTMGIAIQALL
jgi:hypothetical protein